MKKQEIIQAIEASPEVYAQVRFGSCEHRYILIEKKAAIETVEAIASKNPEFDFDASHKYNGMLYIS